MIKQFVREHRYYVVKRKHLSSEQEAKLSELLASFGLPPVRAVVVEEDWPEYEPVWRMIERRCSPSTKSAEEMTNA